MRFLFIFMLAAVCAMIVSLAMAGELLGNKKACARVGELIVESGAMREAGMPWDDVQSRLLELIKESNDDPNGFVKTQKESDFVVAGVRQVWSRKDEPSFVIAGEVYKACIDYKGVKAVML